MIRSVCVYCASSGRSSEVYLDAAARLGHLAGVRAAIVETPYGLASVDVDKPADLDLVRRLTGG